MEDGSSLGIGSAKRHPKGAERGAPRAASAGLTIDPRTARRACRRRGVVAWHQTVSCKHTPGCRPHFYTSHDVYTTSPTPRLHYTPTPRAYIRTYPQLQGVCALSNTTRTKNT